MRSLVRRRSAGGTTRIQFLNLFTVACASLTAQTGGLGVDRERANIVRVTLTVHGLQVSASRVKAGKAQFLFDNQTMMVSPEFTISRLRGQSVNDAKDLLAKDESKGNSKRSWKEVTLTPGTYVVALAQTSKYSVTFQVAQ